MVRASVTRRLDRDWLTMAQAGEYLQVDARTIERWVKRGLLSASQPIPLGRIRISAVSIEKMMEKGRR